MQNKKLVILVVLGVLAVMSLIYGIVAPPKRKYKPSVDIATPSVGKSGISSSSAVALVVDEFIPAERNKKRTEFTSWGRNPFVLQPIASQGTKAISLNGILWDSSKPKAVVNGKIVGVGDKVSKYSVVDIKQDKIILNDGTKNFELRLGQ